MSSRSLGFTEIQACCQRGIALLLCLCSLRVAAI